MRYTRTAITQLTKMYRSVLKKCAFLNALILTGVVAASPSWADYINTETTAFQFGDVSIAGQEYMDNTAFGGRRGAWTDGKYLNTFPQYQLEGRSFGLSGSKAYVGPVELTLRELTDADHLIYNYQLDGNDVDLANLAHVDFGNTQSEIVAGVAGVIGAGNAVYTAPGVVAFANRDNSKAAGSMTVTNSNMVIDGATVNANTINVSSSNLTFAKKGADLLTAGLSPTVRFYTNAARIDSDGKSALNADTMTFDGSRMIVNAGAELTINPTTSATFSNATTEENGGAIYNEGTMNIGSSTFDGNTTASRGGAIFNYGTTSIDGATFTGNRTTSTSYPSQGGAIYNAGDVEHLDKYGILTISNSTFGDANDNTKGNIAMQGGAISNDSGNGYNAELTLNNTNFYYNKAQSSADGGYSALGGAIHSTLNDADVIVNGDTTFKGNSAIGYSAEGGAIYNSSWGKFTFNDTVTFDSNIAEDTNGANGGQGGAISNADGTMVFKDLATFTGNKAIGDGQTSGGAINNDGTLTFENGATFTGNEAMYGGAIFNSDTLTLTDASFTNNTAGDEGGAIFTYGGTVNINAASSDVTFSGNTANDEANDITNYMSTINLNAASGKTIALEGGIDGLASKVAQNKVNITGAGTVEASTIKNQTVAVNGGELHLTTTADDGSNLAGSTVTVASGAIANTIDSVINNYSGTEGGTITLADGAKVKLDADLSAVKSDQFTGSGSINLEELNITADAAGATTLTVATGGATIVADNFKAYTSTQKYIVAGLTGGDAGKITVTQDGTDAGGLENAVADTASGTPETVTYNLTANDTVDDAVTIKNANFTINGDGTEDGDKTVTLAANLSVDTNSTLTIDNAKVEEGATAGAIQNQGAGTVNVNESNIGVGINNVSTGTVNVNGGTIGGNVDNSGTGTVKISDATVTSDVLATSDQIISNSAGATLTVTNTTFTGGGTAKRGRAITNAGTYNNDDNDFDGYVYDNGAAIKNVLTANPKGDHFTNNIADATNRSVAHGGGAIWNSGTLTVEKSASRNGLFSGNVSYTDGGAIYNAGGTATISDTAFLANTAITDAAGAGGAIYNAAGATLNINAGTTFGDGTVVNANQAVNGGAIYNAGTLTVTDANFDTNTATAKGGAIYSVANATINATGSNVSFTGNTANGADNDIYMQGADGADITLALNAAAGKSITLNGGVAGQYYDMNINAATAGDVALGDVAGVDAITVGGGAVSATTVDANSLALNGGTFATTNASTIDTLTTAATTTFTAGNTLGVATALTNAGTLTANGALAVQSGSNSGTINGTGALTLGDGTTTVAFGNTGLISNAISNTAKSTFTTVGVDDTTTPTVGFTGDVANAGTMSVTAGTINSDISGAGALKTADGVAIATGKTVTQGSLDVTGTLTNAGTLTVAGNITGSSTPTITGAGDINLNGGTAVDATAGNAAVINSTGDVTIGGFVASTAAITAKDIAISAGKYLSIGANNLTDSNDASIANAGTLELTGGTAMDATVTNANAVTGTGQTVISGYVTQTEGKAINNTAGISVTGGLVANAGDLDAAVTNTGTLNLTGGTLASNVSGAGTTSITGDVDFADTTTSIGQGIVIANTGNLTADGGNIGGNVAIANGGELDLSGDLVHNITGYNNGVTTTYGSLNVTDDASLTGTAIVDSLTTTAGKTLTTTAATSDITVNSTLTNAGTITGAGDLTLLGGTALAPVTNEGAITTASVVVGDNTHAAVFKNAGTIGSNTVNTAVNVANGTLTNDANKTITGDVTNSGTVTNNGDITGNVTNNAGATANNAGTITGNVINAATGTVANAGTVTGNVTNNGTATNTGLINGNITNNAGTLTTAGVNNTTTPTSGVTGTITNNATLNVTGGTIVGAVTGTGTTTISGAVENGASITGNNIAVAAGGKLTTAADTITDKDGSIANAGTLELTGGALNQNVTGGNLDINGDVAIATTADVVSGSATTIEAGKTLTAGDNDVTLGNTTVNGTLDVGTNNNVTLGDTTMGANGELDIDVTSLTSNSYTGGHLNVDSLNNTAGGKLNLDIANGYMEEQHSQANVKLITDGTGAAINAFTGDQITVSGDYNVQVNPDGSIVVVNKNSYADVSSAAVAGNANNVSAATGWDNATNLPDGSLARAIQKNFNKISKTNPAAYVNALTNLAPTDSALYQSVALEVSNLINEQVTDRLKSQGMNSGDVFERQGAWIKTFYNHAEQDSDRNTPGFTGKTKGIAFGLDGQVDENTTVGVGYSYNTTDADSLNRDIDITGHNIFAYGKYQPSSWFVRGMVNYGLSDYEEKSHVLGFVKTADYDVKNYGFRTYVGYDLPNGFTPEAGLRYTHLTVENYMDSLGQVVRTDDIDILTATLGVNFQKDVETFGYKWTPKAHFGVTYDLANDGADASVVLGNSAYNINGEALDRFGIEAGVGAEMNMGDWSLSAEYEYGYRDNFENHTGMLQLKYNF